MKWLEQQVKLPDEVRLAGGLQSYLEKTRCSLILRAYFLVENGLEKGLALNLEHDILVS